INNKGFHFSFLLHLSIPFWSELYSGRVKNGAYCRKQRRDRESRQCSTKQLDLRPAEGGRAVLSGPAALRRNEQSSAMQDLPFKKLFKGLQFGIAKPERPESAQAVRDGIPRRRCDSPFYQGRRDVFRQIRGGACHASSKN